MLPAAALDWPQEWLESALRHEMGHVRNYDHLKRLAAFLTCAFYWPNPLVWLAAKQLQLAQEEASDNLVLRVGVSAQDYALQLVELIRSNAGRGLLSMPGVAMARPSTLEGRLSAILDDTRNRAGADRRLIMAGTGLAAVLGLALGAVQLRAAEPAAVSPPTPSTAKPGVALIQHKLDSIIIDKVHFNKADVGEVLQFLTVKSKELDPDKEGINFVLRVFTPTPENHVHREVSITLENVPLADLLDYVTQQTNLKWSIQDNAVYFAPAGNPSPEKSPGTPSRE